MKIATSVKAWKCATEILDGNIPAFSFIEGSRKYEIYCDGKVIRSDVESTNGFTGFIQLANNVTSLLDVYAVHKKHKSATKSKKKRPLEPIAQRKRNALLFEAVLLGGTFKSEAEKIGMTPSGVREIFFRIIYLMQKPRRLEGDVVPSPGFAGNLSNIRNHSDFWLAQLAKWRSEHDLTK